MMLMLELGEEVTNKKVLNGEKNGYRRQSKVCLFDINPVACYTRQTNLHEPNKLWIRDEQFLGMLQVIATISCLDSCS